MEAAYYEVDDVEYENTEMVASGVATAGSSMTSVVGSAGGLGNVVGNVAAAASFDEDFNQERVLEREDMTGGVGRDNMASGFTSLGRGLVEGFSGMVTKPIDGAVEEGSSGFFKGLGKGAAGFFAKPLAGVSDAISGMASDAVHDHASRRHEIYSVRPPREVPAEGAIEVLAQPNWQLTAVEVEARLPVASLSHGRRWETQWQPVILKGQPGVLPICEVVVVGVGEPRGEYSMVWNRTTGQTIMLESAEAGKKPLAIGLRRSLVGEPTVCDIALVRLSDLEARRARHPTGPLLPDNYKAIEATPGGRAAVFLASDCRAEAKFEAVVLCVRYSPGPALTDIQVLPDEMAGLPSIECKGNGLPPTHCRVSQTLLNKQHCALMCARTRRTVSLAFWRHDFLFDRRKLGFSLNQLQKEADLVCSAMRLAPITQILIINPHVDQPSVLESSGYTIVRRTPAGSFADLNAGCPGQRLYLAFRRGHGEPISNIAVIQAEHETAPQGDGWVVCRDPKGEVVNMNQGNDGVVMYLFFRVGNSDAAPISQITVIRSDGYAALGKTQRDKEALPTGYSMVRETPGHRSANSNLGTSGHGMFICIQRNYVDI